MSNTPELHAILTNATEEQLLRWRDIAEATLEHWQKVNLPFNDFAMSMAVLYEGGKGYEKMIRAGRNMNLLTKEDISHSDDVRMKDVTDKQWTEACELASELNRYSDEATSCPTVNLQAHRIVLEAAEQAMDHIVKEGFKGVGDA